MYDINVYISRVMSKLNAYNHKYKSYNHVMIVGVFFAHEMGANEFWYVQALTKLWFSDQGFHRGLILGRILETMLLIAQRGRPPSQNLQKEREQG